MTCKTTLMRWASTLGVDLPASATAAQLEAAIESTIAKPADTSITFRQGIQNNLAVLRQELPNTVHAVKMNLLG